MKSTILLLSLLLPLAIFAQGTALSQAEKNALAYMREEEKLARDVYDSMFRKWDVNPFGNIRQSERVHMERMKNLLDTYGLADPVTANKDLAGKFSDPVLQKYYDELTRLGTLSLVDALKAGARIEELDIADLEERMALTNHPDIIAQFNYLKMGSENHLRAFTRRLRTNGIIYAPVILTKEKFDEIIAGDNH